MAVAREATLTEVADGCLAYVQGDGGWGWSNAGLVIGNGTSLLVDTLFDLRLTRRMLNQLAVHTESAPIATVVNTHANGDHCYGNSLVDGAQIVSSTATAREMPLVPPSLLATLTAAPGEVGELFRRFFGEFAFEGIELRVPDQTFNGSLDLDVGGRTVQLREVGPAHTTGDTLVVVPDAGVVYTGDILFIGGTPIAWTGPLANWIAACDLMLDMNVDVVVPGHGPVTDKSGVRAVRDYLAFVEREATARCRAGVDAFDAAREIAAEIGAHEQFATLGEFGRIAVNVDTVYRTVDPAHRPADVVEQFRRMAELEQR